MSREVLAVIDEDIAEGNRLQIRGTPAFVVDEKLMDMQKDAYKGFTHKVFLLCWPR